MNDHRKARPVSGEIMAGARQARAGSAVTLPSDIVDAEYETISIVAAAPGCSAASIGSAQAPQAGMDMLRPQDGARTRRRVRGSPIFWICGMTIAAAAFWVAGGHALIRDLPFTDRAAVGALRISGVTSRVEASVGRKLLLVDGEATNDGNVARTLPPLDIVVSGHDGLTTRYRMGTIERSLRPGETFAFSSRLDVPKNGVKTVSVAFGG